MVDISIHALVKRATGYACGVGEWRVISIHALVKRATTKFIIKLYTILNFNPRPREEGDKPLPLKPQKRNNFNPRPREEGDSRFWQAD